MTTGSRVRLILVLSLAGCASLPPIPAAPRLGQSPAVVAADEQACTAAARADALSYAACMIARGYTVTATMPGPGNTLLNLDIAAASEGRSAQRVRGDLDACGVAWATTARLLVTGGLASPAAVERREREYISCLGGRGYTAARWQSR